MIAMNEKANMTKVMAVIAALAMVVCAFALIMPASETDAAPSDTQSYSGILDGESVKQTFPAGTNVVINDELTIRNGASMYVYGGSLTVNEGTSITIESGGKLIIGISDVEGATAVDTLVTINGTVTVTGDGSIMTIYSAADHADDAKEYEDYGVVVNGTVDVTRNGTIAAGDNNGTILVNNGGNLSLSSSGSRIAHIDGMDVDVAVGGTFVFDGRIGENDMTVSSYGTGTNTTISSVTITNDADLTDNNATSNLTFTTTNSNVTAYQDADNTVPVRQYMLNITGTVDGKDNVQFNDDTAAATKALFTSEDAAKATGQLSYNDKIVGKVIVDSLRVSSGASVDIAADAYVVVNGSLTIVAVTNGSGESATIDDNQDFNGKLELVGTLAANAESFTTAEGILIINGGTATIADYADGDFNFYGAVYVDDDANAYFSGLAEAMAAAAAANVEDVIVSGYNGYVNGDAGRGYYAVTGEITVPDNLTLTILNGLVINADAVLTVNADANIDIDTGSGILVNGKLVDYDTIASGDVQNIDFEVMTQVETETDVINTYTTLAIALAETTEGTIYLYNTVTVTGTMTIPENVTVTYADQNVKGTGISFENDRATLVINGTLDLDSYDVLTVGEGTVTVNNIFVYDGVAKTAGKEIDGAYFTAELGDDTTPRNYITSVAVAADNSDSTENITVYGNIDLGSPTFTAGETGLTVAIETAADEYATAGTVTLVGAVIFQITDGGFTGAVTSDVTAGTSTVSFDKATDVIVTIDSTETTDGSTTEMQIAGSTYADGTVTVAAGTVSIVVDTYFEKLVVAADATLVVKAEVDVAMNSAFKYNTISSSIPVFTDATINGIAGLIVDGTLSIDEGTVGAAVAVIDGNVDIVKGGLDAYIAKVAGTVNADEDSSMMYYGLILDGTIAGDASAYAILAFPGSDMTGAEVTIPNGTQDLNSTVIYVNGAEYATMYAVNDVPVEAFLLAADIPGVQVDTAAFYVDAAMTNLVSDIDAQNTSGTTLDDLNAVASAVRAYAGSTSGIISALAALQGTGIDVGTYSEIYVDMEPSIVKGTVSVGTGLDLYIDNVRVSVPSNEFELSVGTHTVSFDVKAGYDGANATITFNGQTVQNGGSITITADMTEYTLVASGAAPSQGQVVIDQTGGDDGMGITDYLLIILVILVIVLAIFVALKMMRS